MYDVIVIGAGIVGATIAEAFRRIQHREVLVIDDGDPMAGTWPSGGSVKPSPLTGLSDEQLKPTLAMLDCLWGLSKERFEIRPSGGFLKADVYHIPMDDVYGIATTYGHVKAITPAGQVEWVHEEDEMITNQAKLVIVAAGMGCANLFPELFPKGTLTAKQGVSFHFLGEVKQPFVQAWAPYKQITVHNIIVDGITRTWAADGSALKPESWTEGRSEECLNRIKGAMKRTDDPIEVRTGLRSFHSSKAKPLYLKEIQPGIWIAAGAGKFGCISAGWAANELLSH